ncbi:MAG: galactose ABC transporter substrate-binding protein [Anaerolineaceae bacterium]|nr:galactose ABC transporter substrate-binding protein [Anaerolineaceae bacterium]
MKKALLFLLVVSMLALVPAVFADDAPVAGVIWYNFADTFIQNARQTLLNTAAADGTIEIIDADSMNDAATQTNNLNNMYTNGVKYLVLNNINTAGISEICEQGKEEGVTMIFANTDSPSDEDFENYENLYLVTSRAEMSGTMMGKAVVDYWTSHPEADRNGNGKLDYIMLLGFTWHYDTQVRAEYSIAACEEAGIETNRIGGEVIAEYNRGKAQEMVAALLANYGDDIDVVFACNDDMALGAIEALKAGGFFQDEASFIPVCGVDATVVGCEAVEEGTMLVTALNNPVKLGKAIYKVMWLLENGQEVTTETLDMEGVEVEGHRVWINYVGITKDNLEEAAYDITDPTF